MIERFVGAARTAAANRRGDSSALRIGGEDLGNAFGLVSERGVPVLARFGLGVDPTVDCVPHVVDEMSRVFLAAFPRISLLVEVSIATESRVQLMGKHFFFFFVKACVHEQKYTFFKSFHFSLLNCSEDDKAKQNNKKNIYMITRENFSLSPPFF